MNLTHNEILKVYTSPESYILERVVSCDEVRSYPLSGESVRVHRDSDRMELFIERAVRESDHSINIVIPMSEGVRQRNEALAAELFRRRSPILTPYEICRMRCVKRGERPMPLLIEVAVQSLPHGELLSEAVRGAAFDRVERIYIAISYLERALCDSAISFKSLRAEDIILGDDGLLYPFRYTTLLLDKRDESVCDMLRSDIFRISGYEISCPITRQNRYTKTQCDTDGGHLSSRAPHEGLIAVEDVDGWGFVDMQNRVVIEPQYRSVSDFTLGMAVVQLFDTDLYGVIDREGKFLHKPIYGGIRIDDDGEVTHWDSF